MTEKSIGSEESQDTTSNQFFSSAALSISFIPALFSTSWACMIWNEKIIQQYIIILCTRVPIV